MGSSGQVLRVRSCCLDTRIAIKESNWLFAIPMDFFEPLATPFLLESSILEMRLAAMERVLLW